ncbi:hypothetical protein N7508_007750 [Penicillium antarcticum]|uniref:uncharacterized protein n=1 Tax=Penicillium antarcticum TaxID=416450 RepID=UPI0023A6BAFA|nr:uncharacterized protein N7508_007750 [Penicillium antarcticum]KAJ5297501.1 hypothetical protein N7508_007750 [Penicillium antarcticum]
MQIWFWFQPRDLLPDENNLLAPLTWTFMRGGTWSNSFGEYIKDERRQWGLVMWDAAQFDNTERKEDLSNIVEELGDPREIHEYMVDA